MEDWLKMEGELWKRYAEAVERGQTGNAKQEKLSENPEVNKMLELWVYKALCDGIDVAIWP
ncbi:hypothetical protein C0993_001026 [Termitomyces sp. T159_Od127]|nr:hypothetical protein C0993_001026 [Termitomyces sp. T159_Od127]